MKYAVIDTETNGLFDYKKPADDPCQPRLASLGVVLLNEDLTTGAEHHFFVKPDGWEMSPETTAVNGLTTEFLTANGVHILEVLSFYARLIDAGYAVAAFGAQFDCKQMRGEMRRNDVPDRFETTLNVCLMRACMGLKIPKAGKPGGWPKLSDVCRFFGVAQGEAHSALGDARSAADVLRAMAARKVKLTPEVHYKADSPKK